jgi:hypothetical protein
MLRRENFAGSIVMLSSDAAAPVDCPSLSKDYLAPATPQRTGCRTGRHHSTQKAPSTCESRRRLFAFIPVRGKSRPQVDRVFGMIDCCLLPGLSRFVTGSPGATRRTFILFVRLRIAVPSSDAHKRAQGNHSVQILSGLKLRLLCVAAASRFMRRQ